MSFHRVKSEPSYIEQSSEQKTRASEQATAPQFGERLIPEDKPELVAEWNAWLTAEGFPILQHLGIRKSRQGAAGYLMPRLYPPDERDPDALLLVKRWLRFRCEQIENRAGRYAAQ